MNKKLVDRLIPIAYMELATVEIAKDNTIPKTFRGQISSFGAAVSNGSLLAAVAFFSDKGGSSVDRTLLMKAINHMLENNPVWKDTWSERSTLFEKVRDWSGSDQEIKKRVLTCAVALKLAMNLYQLKDKEDAT